MNYCPKCGGFAKHAPDCNLTIIGRKKERWVKDLSWGRGRSPKMLPVTTANYFCGFCNKILAAGIKECPYCHRPTSQVTNAHLQPGILLLSGSRAAKIWDPVK
jgi:hypothetical protein